MRQSELPESRAASTKPASRRTLASARAMRAYSGKFTIAVASTMFCTVLPNAATMPIASTNSGNAMMVSAMRPTMRSVQPPKKPAATPARPPIRNTSATDATAMKKSSRVATMTRLNTARQGRPRAEALLRCRSCFEPHARIDQAVEHVDHQVERDIHHRHGEHETLHWREVGGE